MKHWKPVLLCSLLGAASLQASAACYTVYDKGNNVVYNAQTAPVDMKRPLHETLPRVFPGGHMVFDAAGECPVDQPLPRVALRSNGGPAPLLTDRRTAEAMNAPHTVLASGAALVPSGAQAMPSGMVVAVSPAPAPSSTQLAVAEPDTRTMGAGPARPRNDMVITEMRDGLTVMQSNGAVVITR